jgi:hypothetical protein
MSAKFIKPCLFLTFVFFISCTIKSQDSGSDTIAGKDKSGSAVKLNVGSDIMSRYIWRGTDFGDSPAVQPTLSISVSNFEAGCWSSVATNSFYKEIDLYAKYTVKNFSLIFTDYYVTSVNGTPASPDTRYFVYDDQKTAHSFEGSLLYKGSEKFPLWLLGGVFFYGNDKRWGYDAEKDSTNQTYYSSYLEAGYTFSIKDSSADVFLGFTPAAGAYGNTLGVINIGVTGYRKIKITDEFELPVKASLIFNPQSSNVYFVFGITL